MRDALDRVLASSDFSANARRRAFLEYIVERTLAGDGPRLKGYTIAVEVFGRSEDFDPQSDSVVRLEARRLRADLDGYYANAGRTDPVRIAIPKGSYIPTFERTNIVPDQPVAPDDPAAPEPVATPESHPRPRSRLSHLLLPLAGVLFLVLAGGGIFLWQVWDRDLVGTRAEARLPAVVVRPFESAGPTESSRFMAMGMTNALIGDLMRFPGIRVYDWDSERVGRAISGAGLPAFYEVTGNVHVQDETVYVFTELHDARTARILWSESYQRPLRPEALTKVQAEAADEIATALGQTYGVIADDLRRKAAMDASAEIDSYLCVQRAFGYRRAFENTTYQPVIDCLQRTVERDPNYADAWAMLGWTYLDAGRFAFDGHQDPAPDYEAARAASERAMELDPDNTLALKSLAAVEYYTGNFDRAERLSRRAAELNPNDPDALAQLGYRLVIRGNPEEGLPLLERAMARTVNPPFWYNYAIALDRFKNGDYVAMDRIVRRYEHDDTGFGEAMSAIVAGALGQSARAREALERMDSVPAMQRGVATYFRQHGVDDETVAMVLAGLDKARKVASGEI